MKKKLLFYTLCIYTTPNLNAHISRILLKNVFFLYIFTYFSKKCLGLLLRYPSKKEESEVVANKRDNKLKFSIYIGNKSNDT